MLIVSADMSLALELHLPPAMSLALELPLRIVIRPNFSKARV